MGFRSMTRFLNISTTTLLKRILYITKGVQSEPVYSNQINQVDKIRTFLRYNAR